jgi:hypothetical protein
MARRRVVQYWIHGTATDLYRLLHGGVSPAIARQHVRRHGAGVWKAAA